MSVGEFLDFCYDPRMLVNIKIYDSGKQEVIYSGDYDDMPRRLLGKEISSWDVPNRAGKISLNIN